ncbi:MAG: hypothetical protein ACP5F3_01180 [Candidatus Syntrophosphaera sp.]
MKEPKLVHLFLAIVFLGAMGCAGILGGRVEYEMVEEKAINEASGIAASLKTPGLLYTHNDSGGEAALYVLNKIGLMPARIILSGVRNRDWEDIAVARDPNGGTPHIYIGDIGDNQAQYSSCTIYRFPEPAITDTLLTLTQIESIEFAYEDGPRDSEAMFVDPRTGDIFIISKREEHSGIYRIPYPQSTTLLNLAERIGSLPYNWVTAADISPSGKYILVKTYSAINRYARGPGESIGEALRGKCKSLKYLLEEQGEAVAWDCRGNGYFTISERLGATPVNLYYYP